MVPEQTITQASSEVTGKGQEPHGSRLRQAVTILVLIIFQLPLAGYLAPGEGLYAQVMREGIYLALTFFLLVYVRVAERRSLSSIGLKQPTLKSVGFGVAGALVLITGFAFIYMIIFPALGLPVNESQMAAVKSMPLWFRFLLVVRAAVFEEIYYRGFAIERLTELTGLRWLASLISLAAFTFAHLAYWGWAHLIVAAFGGALLTVLYLYRRDLACNMVAHLITDGVGFLLG